MNTQTTSPKKDPAKNKSVQTAQWGLITICSLLMVIGLLTLPSISDLLLWIIIIYFIVKKNKWVYRYLAYINGPIIILHTIYIFIIPMEGMPLELIEYLTVFSPIERILLLLSAAISFYILRKRSQELSPTTK